MDRRIRELWLWGLESHDQEMIQCAWLPTFSDDALNLGKESITLKELFPIVLACAVWHQDFEKSRVVVHSDNLVQSQW